MAFRRLRRCLATVSVSMAVWGRAFGGASMRPHAGLGAADVTRELRRYLDERGVRHQDCFEKQELLERVQEHMAQESQAGRSTRSEAAAARSARSSTASRFAQFGDLVDVPAQGQEEGVFIFLHGFGDSARGFASQLPNLLQMPQMRYVLPTAPSLGGMRSWFTPAALGGGGESVAVKESVEYVHELIRQEITRGVRPGQIFVGGFSQGGCVAVRAALSFPDASLGGAVAASTFLSMSRSPEAVSIAEPNRPDAGNADGAVPSLAGKQLVEQLRNQGVPAEFKSYPTMGHAYCPEEPAKPPLYYCKRKRAFAPQTAEAPEPPVLPLRGARTLLQSMRTKPRSNPNLPVDDGEALLLVRKADTWAPDQAAEFFVAATRVGDTRATSAVAERLKLLISQLLPEISPKLLAGLAHSLRASSRPDSAHGDFVLLHAICRRAAKAFKEHQLSPDAAVTLLLVCSRWEIHDEELLQNASQTLEEKAEELPVRDLCEVIYAVSSMHVKDVIGLEAICRQLMDRAADMAEPDLVRLLRGLLKLRHHDEALMGVLAPLVLASQTRMQSIAKIALARRSVEQSLSPSFSPVQAMSSLAALAKLQQRNLVAASVFTSVLCGMGSSTVWHWAKSPYFAKHLDTSIQVPRFSKKRGAPFDLAKCRTFLGALEASKCVEILHSLSTLELHSRLTVHLTAMLCSILAPQMHELRAKEVLVVARAFSVDRLPNFLWRDAAEGPEGWRERALDLCFQSLRRHEHFLDSSYESLLPFKLLCLQVNFGTFGTRRLQEFLMLGSARWGENMRFGRLSEHEIPTAKVQLLSLPGKLVQQVCPRLAQNEKALLHKGQVPGKEQAMLAPSAASSMPRRLLPSFLQRPSLPFEPSEAAAFLLRQTHTHINLCFIARDTAVFGRPDENPFGSMLRSAVRNLIRPTLAATTGLTVSAFYAPSPWKAPWVWPFRPHGARPAKATSTPCVATVIWPMAGRGWEQSLLRPQPSVRDYGLALRSLAQGRSWRSTVELLQAMEVRRVEANLVIFNTALTAQHWPHALHMLKVSPVSPQSFDAATCGALLHRRCDAWRREQRKTGVWLVA
eukprot:g1142.t1